jgi:geranylgeranyl diphosphate synthase, type II
VAIEEYLRRHAAEVDAALVAWVRDRKDRIEPKLLEAMEYSLVSPGKRMRPVLVLAAVEAAGAEPTPFLPFACAVEMVHAYSLIHDDLPAMDDDDLRRGRPTNHKVFGEAMAILAGDGLLTEAFALLSSGAVEVAAERRLAAAAELAFAAGAEGMVGGQAADILAEGITAELEQVKSIHRRKTGALLRASVRIGALACGAAAPTLDRLSRYGEAIGLAFQVADDLLDEIGNPETTGKNAQRDRALGKATVPAVLGVARARELLRELLERALGSISDLGSAADPLRDIARQIVGRAL